MVEPAILTEETGGSEIERCQVENQMASDLSKTANIIKDDITSQHSNILAMCCKVISFFVIFAVLDLRVGGCRP